PPARLRLALLIVFAVAWVLTFMTWVISQRTLDVTTLLQATIVLAVPLAFGALSGVLSERAGVINIAIEGQLLFGAFGATLIGSLAGNVWIGLLSAPFMAMVMGALLALFAVGYHVQQIIVGVVLNVLAIGVTSFFFGTVMRDNPGVFNSPMRLPTLRIPLLADIPVIGRMLFEQNILVYLMWIIVAGLTVALFRTRWGLRVRAVGEHPKAADTVGIAVNLTRWKNVLLGSAVAGLGGATLTIGTGVAFGEEMSAGKGDIALAAMGVGRYHPVGGLLAALGRGRDPAPLEGRAAGGGRGWSGRCGAAHRRRGGLRGGDVGGEGVHRAGRDDPGPIPPGRRPAGGADLRLRGFSAAASGHHDRRCGRGEHSR